MENVDHLVIGGGVMGSAAAWQLARARAVGGPARAVRARARPGRLARCVPHLPPDLRPRRVPGPDRRGARAVAVARGRHRHAAAHDHRRRQPRRARAVAPGRLRGPRHPARGASRPPRRPSGGPACGSRGPCCTRPTPPAGCTPTGAVAALQAAAACARRRRPARRPRARPVGRPRTACSSRRRTGPSAPVASSSPSAPGPASLLGRPAPARRDPGAARPLRPRVRPPSGRRSRTSRSVRTRTPAERTGSLTPGEGVKVGFHAVGPVTDPDHRSFTPEPGQLALLQRYAEQWMPGVDASDPHPISCTYTTTPTATSSSTAAVRWSSPPGSPATASSSAPRSAGVLADLADEPVDDPVRASDPAFHLSRLVLQESR